MVLVVGGGGEATSHLPPSLPNWPTATVVANQAVGGNAFELPSKHVTMYLYNYIMDVHHLKLFQNFKCMLKELFAPNVLS